MQSRGTQLRVLPPISGYFPSQNLLHALDDSKIGVVICDRRMRYKALNKSVAEIHSEPIEAHLGHFFHEIIGNLADKVVPLWEKVFSTGEPSPNLEVTGHLPKRPAAGRWIENLFPLVDRRGRVSMWMFRDRALAPSKPFAYRRKRIGVCSRPPVFRPQSKRADAPFSQRARGRPARRGR